MKLTINKRSMKLIKASILFVTAATFLVSCGGKTAKSTENVTEQVTDSTDSKKVEAGVYVNEKYGFTIKYPDANFELKQATDSSATFESADGKAALNIHVGNLTGKITDMDDFRKAYDEDSKSKGRREVTYNAFNVANYVIMGYEVKTIFYQKTIITEGIFATAILTYDDADKDTYYPMIEPIFNSFK